MRRSVRVKQWRCRNPPCMKRTFADQLLRVAAACAMMTDRVAELAVEKGRRHRPRKPTLQNRTRVDDRTVRHFVNY